MPKITIGGRPEMTIGEPKVRVGIYVDDFEKLKERLKK